MSKIAAASELEVKPNVEHLLQSAVPAISTATRLFISKSVQCSEPPPHLKLVVSRGVQCEEPEDLPQQLKVVAVLGGVQYSVGELTAVEPDENVDVKPNVEYLLQEELTPDVSEPDEVKPNLQHLLQSAVPLRASPAKTRLLISKSVQCSEPPLHLKLVASRGVQCDEAENLPLRLKLVSESRGIQCSEGELTAATSEPDDNDEMIPNIEHLLQTSVPETPTEARLRKKVKLLQQRLKLQTSRIKNMNAVINRLRKKCGAPDTLI